MAHIEIKTIKGHDYIYARQSYRVGNKIRHKHIAYLGAVRPLRMQSIGVPAPSIPSAPSVPSIRLPRKKKVSIRYEGLKGKTLPEAKEKKEIIIRKFKKKIRKRIIKKKLKELKKEKPDTDNLFRFLSI